MDLSDCTKARLENVFERLGIELKLFLVALNLNVKFVLDLSFLLVTRDDEDLA